MPLKRVREQFVKERRSGGLWSLGEKSSHVNFLEMKAVLFGLESFCRDLRIKHIRVESDNTTTVAYINAMGGIKSTVCNEMALQLWQWSCGRNIRLSACHLQAQATRLQTVGRGILMAPLNGPLTLEYLKILAVRVSGGLSKLTCLHLG